MTLSWSDPEPEESPFEMTGRNRSRAAQRDFSRVTVRGRLQALGLRWAAGRMHRTYGARKESLFADLPDTVMEIGPGAGANFRYYRPGTRVIAVEPASQMHGLLRREAERRGIELEIHSTPAESMPLDDASVDAVVSTLVLCSVSDPRGVLGEVRRVLRPGGQFIFIEHVASDPGTRLHRLQGWLRRPWAWVCEGCELRRNTGAIIRAAGFDSVDEERFRAFWRGWPISPHVAGIARR